MRRKPSRSEPAAGPVLQVHRSRTASVEGSSVRRALPHPLRRTVGAWCFLDHFGPAPVPAGTRSLDVAPHPHCGLATVTWLLQGQAVHRDSLGSVQPIRPGQLNWMSAGHGISHAEEGVLAQEDGAVHGVQLWVAQPEHTRHTAARFEHHAELPHLDLPGLHVSVLVGSCAGERSPARADTPLFAADVLVAQGSHGLPIDPDFEHALVVLEGAVQLEGTRVEPGELAYLGRRRRELVLTGAPEARVMVIGGEPLDEPLLMGWNFVVRDEDELEAAYRSWETDDGRFGTVNGARGERILPR